MVSRAFCGTERVVVHPDDIVEEPATDLPQVVRRQEPGARFRFEQIHLAAARLAAGG